MRQPQPARLPSAAAALLLAAAAARFTDALKDGLDAQLFPCNALSVRQAWQHGGGGGGGAGRLHLRWTGVDPPLTQALVHLPDGAGAPPRQPKAGQLTTWSVQGPHAGGRANASCSGAPRRLGCFTDNAVKRMLGGAQQSGDEMTRGKCAAFCKGGGFGFMAVEDRAQCFCGKTNPGPSADHQPGPAWCAGSASAAGCDPACLKTARAAGGG